MNAIADTKITFKTIAKDPIKVMQYTLSNGLKLFMTINKEEPRVYTEIAVRVGSKHDPADTTGLAHYFEHMMFKGTDKLGSLDWEKEKIILDKIENLFEQHRAETDPIKKKELYAQIDNNSFEAAKLAAANEYDKLVSAIGAKGTNAYTWLEQTVYVNDIPTNELERWFQLESERFRRPVLRLFHTELETVFEEYNISQDKDFRKALKVMQEMLTPTHPYGTQTTLGRGEDLKNPSQTNIYRFFDTYYVPNNIGMVLSGDFDPEYAVRLAEKYFGSLEKKKIPAFKYEPQAPITQRTQRDVYGNEAPWVELGWRFEGAKTEESIYLPLISGLLYNQQAGLIDLNLIQKQQVLEAYAYPRIHEDYSALAVYGKPREGQTLADVEKLLLKQIADLRAGNFEEWLPEAVIKDMKLSEIKEFEKNQGRASMLTSAYVLGIEWSEMLLRFPKLEKISKKDIVDFANKYLREDNFAVVYKHTGEDKNVMKVEKPDITAVELNRVDNSGFAKKFMTIQTPDISPDFLDFKSLIKKSKLHARVNLHNIQERGSKLFRLYYIFEMGKNSDPLLSMAAAYLPYLGTSRYTATQMQQAFYRLGVNFTVNCQEERMYLSLTGLEESFDEAVKLTEHLLTDAQPNADALQNLVADTLTKRINAKLDKGTILRKAMTSYAKHGKNNPYSDKMSEAKLLSVQPTDLISLVKGLANYEHTVFYHGAKNTPSLKKILNQHHVVPKSLHKPIEFKKYPELSVKKDLVYFVHFPTVQVELLLLSKGTPQFNLQEFFNAEWYNQYFGYGLSSIVFQDIRESKALAYSAYAYAASPSKKKKPHYLQAYVGTQPDKLQTAVEAFQTILEEMPISESQIENARQGIIKQMAAERITKSDIYWNWRSNIERGFSTDLRAKVFEFMQQATTTDLIEYQKKYIKGRHFTWLVLGDRSQMDFKYLKKIGKVKELSLEEIFGY
jgi:predicted Zn-dependent peptidase